MDHLKVWTRDAADGYTEVVVEGDVAAFQWMIAAAGNARDGFLGNQADTTDGAAARLVLQPLVPNVKADQVPRSRTAHLRVDHRGAQEASKIVLEQAEYDAIPDKVKAELHHRGIRFAVVADVEIPAVEPPAPPVEQAPSPPTDDQLAHTAHAGPATVAGTPGPAAPPAPGTLSVDELVAVLRNDTDHFPQAGEVEIPAALEELQTRATLVGPDAAVAAGALGDLKHRDVELAELEREQAAAPSPPSPPAAT